MQGVGRVHKGLSLLLKSDSGLLGQECEPAGGRPCLPEWVVMMCATSCGTIRLLLQTFLTPASVCSGHVEDQGEDSHCSSPPDSSF